MSTNTKIEWCDATWNCLRGCSRVSEGCRNCYAERMAARFSGTKATYTITSPGELSDPVIQRAPFHGFAAMTPSGPRWTGRVELIEDALDLPLHWRKPRRIFANSMSDLFHEALSDEAIDRVFAVMALCQQHTFMVLTKRTSRMREWFGASNRGRRVCDLVSEKCSLWDDRAADNLMDRWSWPLPNVWLGVSCEDQAAADSRIPHLLRTPAAVRFVSLEPLLGPVDVGPYLSDLDGEFEIQMFDGVSWVVVGGESGPGARPCHPDWVRSIRDQCVEAQVPFFFKQWGEWAPCGPCQPDAEFYGGSAFQAAHGGQTSFDHAKENHRRFHVFSPEAIVERVGKKAAGALLDGREWRQFPEVRP